MCLSILTLLFIQILFKVIKIKAYLTELKRLANLLLVMRSIPVALRNQNTQFLDFYLRLGRFANIFAEESWLGLNHVGTMRVCAQSPVPPWARLRPHNVHF